MRIFAIANQKGGVGKTSTCVNLAAELARCGIQVTVIDMDPQGNATSGLGVDRSKLEKSLYDALIGRESLESVAIETPWENLHLIPSTLDLAGAEIELSGVLSRETRLKQQLNALTRSECVLIDCPPSLGLLTVNALVASQTLLIPIQCEYYAMEGLGQLMKTVELIRESLNGRLEIGGLLLTMYDSRTRLSREVCDEVRRQFRDLVFKTVIPRNVRISEAPSYGLPVSYYDPSSAGTEAYRDFSKEVIERWFAQKL